MPVCDELTDTGSYITYRASIASRYVKAQRMLRQRDMRAFGLRDHCRRNAVEFAITGSALALPILSFCGFAELRCDHNPLTLQTDVMLVT